MMGLMVGWLIAKEALRDEYGELDLEDMPESLQKFIGDVLAGADEFEQTLFQ